MSIINLCKGFSKGACKHQGKQGISVSVREGTQVTENTPNFGFYRCCHAGTKDSDSQGLRGKQAAWALRTHDN